jgi:hypothetical protein
MFYLLIRRQHKKLLKEFFAYVYKAEGKRPLGIPRQRWKDNIKMDI